MSYVKREIKNRKFFWNALNDFTPMFGDSIRGMTDMDFMSERNMNFCFLEGKNMFNKTINLPEGQRIGFSALDKRLGSPSVFNIVGLEKIPGKTCNTEDCPMCEGRGRVDVLIPTNYNYYLIPIQNFKEKETYNVTERKLNHSDFVNIIKDITDGFDR